MNLCFVNEENRQGGKGKGEGGPQMREGDRRGVVLVASAYTCKENRLQKRKRVQVRTITNDAASEFQKVEEAMCKPAIHIRRKRASRVYAQPYSYTKFNK